MANIFGRLRRMEERTAGRVALRVTTGLLLLFAIVVWKTRLDAYVAGGALGVDYRHFVAYGQRYLTTRSIYTPDQLAGPFDWSPQPYDPQRMPALYPPLLVYVVIPLTVLPSLAWWAIPLATIAYSIIRWRPASWSWPLLAVALLQSASIIFAGSSTMWIVALVAAGLRWGWPAALILIKPTFAPFALTGAWSRSWWLALVILAVLAVPLGQEWLRYATVVANARASPFYASGEWPVALAPVIAWLARDERRAHSRGH